MLYSWNIFDIPFVDGYCSTLLLMGTSAHFCWWVLQHCIGFARLVWGRPRVHRAFIYSWNIFDIPFVDGYCSTVQGLLDWFEVDLGVPELSFIHETYLTYRLAACCSVLHCAAVCCSVLHCAAVCRICTECLHERYLTYRIHECGMLMSWDISFMKHTDTPYWWA